MSPRNYWTPVSTVATVEWRSGPQGFAMMMMMMMMMMTTTIWWYLYFILYRCLWWLCCVFASETQTLHCYTNIEVCVLFSGNDKRARSNCNLNTLCRIVSICCRLHFSVMWYRVTNIQPFKRNYATWRIDICRRAHFVNSVSNTDSFSSLESLEYSFE